MLNKLLKSRSANAYKMLQQNLHDANLLLTARLTFCVHVFAVHVYEYEYICMCVCVCVAMLQNVIVKVFLKCLATKKSFSKFN